MFSSNNLELFNHLDDNKLSEFLENLPLPPPSSSSQEDGNGGEEYEKTQRLFQQVKKNISEMSLEKQNGLIHVIKAINKNEIPNAKDLSYVSSGVVDVYKTLPMEMKENFTKDLPPQVKVMVPMIESLPSETLEKLMTPMIKIGISQLSVPEEEEGMMNNGNDDENNKSTEEEEVEDMIESASKMEKEKKEKTKEKDMTDIDPVLIAEVFTQIQNLPPKLKQTMIQQVPEECKMQVTQVVQLTEGMGEAEVMEVVVMMQNEMKSKNPNNTFNNGNETETELTEEERKQAEVKAVKEKMKKMAILFIKCESRRLLKWCKDSPCSLRVLGFLSGLGFVASSAFSFWFNLLSGQFAAWVVQWWLFIFGVFIMICEAKVYAIQTGVIPKVVQYVQFVSSTSGRGGFLIFVGFLGASLIGQGNWWQNILNLIAGGFSIVVGMMMMISGAYASNRLKTFKEKLVNEVDVKEAFQKADKDESGALDIEELASLCETLGSCTLSKQQLEVVLNSLDVNNDGTISEEEFLEWWGSTTTTTSQKDDDISPNDINIQDNDDIEAPPEDENDDESKNMVSDLANQKEAVRNGPSLMRELNVVAGLSLIICGLLSIGLIIREGNDFLFSYLFVAVLNVWIVVFGMFMLSLEMGGSCCGKSSSDGINKFTKDGVVKSNQMKNHIIDKYCRGLDTVVGRGLLYIFVGTMTIGTFYSSLGYEGIFVIFAGIFVIVMGFINIFFGMKAISIFKNIRQGYASHDEVKSLFHASDKDASGKLDFGELAELCEKLGIKLDRRQWELLVEQLDKDGDGTVDFTEFQSWWTRELI